MQKQENSFQNILFSILIPVLILNKGHKFGLDAKLSVILALSFPLFFSIKSVVQKRKVDFISVLGLVNVLSSGILTLLALGGVWFALKEALFPLLIGIFVFISSYTAKPFFETLFLNPAAFEIDKLNERIDSSDKKLAFAKLMKTLTRFLSLSFLFSSLLNFVLALYVFQPLPEALTQVQKQELLNEQLSKMTLYSLGIILIPSMIFLGTILYFAFKKISDLTGLKTDELLKK